jgi:hypothetical protein
MNDIFRASPPVDDKAEEEYDQDDAHPTVLTINFQKDEDWGKAIF